MSPLTVALSQRILARLMPPAQAEALLGDLLEECRLRLRVESPASATRWYWMQFVSSMPVLLWTSLRRGAWLITVVIAVASYIAAAAIELALGYSLTRMTTSESVRLVIVLLCYAAALAPCGYVAASIRPGSARLLAFLVFATQCLMLATGSRAPLWFGGSLLILGPVATIVGAALSGRWRPGKPSGKLPSKI
jgi:hypothetical protein